MIRILTSATRDEHIFRRAAQAARDAPARPAATRASAAWLVAREIQTLRTARLPLRQQSRPRPQALSVDQRHRSTSANRLCAERRLTKVSEYLDNYRRVRDALNEICAINTELLRRREE